MRGLVAIAPGAAMMEESTPIPKDCTTIAGDENLALEDIPFVIVDVETTGTDPKNNRIMEIACIVMQDGRVVEEFSSLIKPGQFIPGFVARLTGISNAMVCDAPDAREVFETLHRYLSIPNAVFVAHNVEFDWAFVHNTLKREHLPTINMPRLCTYKLARRLLTRNRKFSLEALVSYFGLASQQYHRARSDTRSTAGILHRFLNELRSAHHVETRSDLLRFQNRRLSAFRAPSQIFKRLEPTLRQLPRAAGVYYFYSKFGEILYIGKARCLRERVRSYFQSGAQHVPKIAEMVRKVHEIRWECTGTELSALLLESLEIKTHKPRYNTMIKRYRSYTFLRLSAREEFPTLDWCYEIEDDGAEYYGPFRGRVVAENLLDSVNRTFRLRECKEILRPSESAVPCFYYQIKRCKAPCALMQKPEEYASEVEQVRRFLSGSRQGVLSTMRAEMERRAEAMEFEEALVLRDRIRDMERVFYRQQQICTSLNDNNLILILPAGKAAGTVEVFFVRFGRLRYQRVLDHSLPCKELRYTIAQVFFDGSAAPEYCSKAEIDEIRIIATWIHQRREEGAFLYTGQQNEEQLYTALMNILPKAIAQASCR